MALQSGKGVPFEFVEYRLCKELHCLPSELEKQPWEKIDNFLEFMNLEGQFQQKEDRLVKQKTKRFPKN